MVQEGVNLARYGFLLHPNILKSSKCNHKEDKSQKHISESLYKASYCLQIHPKALKAIKEIKAKNTKSAIL